MAPQMAAQVGSGHLAGQLAGTGCRTGCILQQGRQDGRVGRTPCNLLDTLQNNTPALECLDEKKKIYCVG